MSDIYDTMKEMRSDFQYLSRLKQQIVQTEGEPETADVPGYDWDCMDADFDDRERTAAIMAEMTRAEWADDESDITWQYQPHKYEDEDE